MKLIQGDCLKELRKLHNNSIDSIVTDPPYGLKFMNKKWDYDVPTVEMWQEALRVLKPGGHLLSFGGSRTYHRMAVAIEDAGFEIRDQIMWLYGSGFPKSHNVGKAVDKLQGNEREHLKENPNKRNEEVEKSSAGKSQSGRTTHAPITKGNSKWEGWGTALKPAHEPIVLARKPLSEKTIASNVLKWGTGGINVDGCRVDNSGANLNMKQKNFDAMGYHGAKETKGIQTHNPKGRFPANLIHDGSKEVVSGFPNTGKGNGGNPYNYKGKEYNNKDTSMFNGDKPQAPSNFNDSGSASRFFYCAKASKSERNAGLEGFETKDSNYRTEYRPTAIKSGDKGQDTPYAGVNRSGGVKNNHPTVKPLKLMQYLVCLITPPKGTVLDPFMGSGTTGMACKKEGFDFIGIELEKEYCDIARARISQILLKALKEKDLKKLSKERILG